MVNTKVLKIDPEKIDIDKLVIAADVLKNGGLVVFPTETVYGLGALMKNIEAVKKIFLVKNRPMDNPLIIHVSSVEMFNKLIEKPVDKIYRLIEKFWPGPLTIIWWRSKNVPDIVSAGLPKVAIRMPAHPVALKLIDLVGEPVVAPSANRSGKPSPTNIEHVLEDLLGLVEIVIDSGDTLYGVESTIIDLTADPPVLLRPGALPVEALEEAVGEKIVVTDTARGYREYGEAVAPGTRYRHYAPEAELVVVETSDYRYGLNRVVTKIRELISEYSGKYNRIGVICSSETCSKYMDLDIKIYDIGSRRDLFIVARNLFKTLRRIDHDGVEIVFVEGFEEKGLGLAIMNRLRKASNYNTIKID